MSEIVHVTPSSRPDNDCTAIPELPSPPAAGSRAWVWLLITLSAAVAIGVGVGIGVHAATGNLRLSMGCGLAMFSVMTTVLGLAGSAGLGS